MIRRIPLSEDDKKSILSHEFPKKDSFQDSNFIGRVVNKPWGYEYLMFENKDISIWMLYIKKGHFTSMHCHPNKKTSLLVISGEAISSNLKEKFNLKEKEGIILEKGVFHRTEAISDEGIFVMEVETPSNKTDLFRLEDKYNRVLKGYTNEKNISTKVQDYPYVYIKDENKTDNFLGKLRFYIKEFKNTGELKNEVEHLGAHIGVLLSGEVKVGCETLDASDLVEINDLKKAEINSPIRILLIQERKNLIKLSDYVISFLQKSEFRDVFMVSGGHIMHLLESVRSNGMNFTCNHHEQASAMAADGYARITGKPGFALVTSGPGGTNAVTGIAGAWIDSIPMVVISGQCSESQTIGESGLRQLGVQEINIVDIVRPITKYAVMIKDPKKIKYHLEKALYLAKSGRPGPVLLDIPINLQRAMIEIDELDSFKAPQETEPKCINLKEEVGEIIRSINEAKRPIMLLGGGVRLAKAEKEAIELAERLSIPIVTSRNGNDLIWEDHELYGGRIGSFGQRAGNFAIQNSDLLISVGSRLALAVTGWDYSDFARGAKRIIVDIDETELKKPIINPDMAIKCDAKKFISEMLSQIGDYHPQDTSEWKQRIKYWKDNYPVNLPEYKDIKDSVNTYYFTDVLSDELSSEDIVLTDMGMSFQCVSQAIKLKKGQRIFTESGLAPMGCGLPMAIGACVGNNNKKVICITGDGGLQMNIQELETVAYNKLPIKIFLFNNKGYSSIRETQKNYFKDFVGSEASSGVGMPDFIKVAEAHGIKTKKIENQETLREDIREVLEYEGPVFCDLNISENQIVMPKQGVFKRPDGSGAPRPIEDMLPYIDRSEFEKNMVIEAIPFDPYVE